LIFGTSYWIEPMVFVNVSPGGAELSHTQRATSPHMSTPHKTRPVRFSCITAVTAPVGFAVELSCVQTYSQPQGVV
jgi:hypothetical protein